MISQSRMPINALPQAQPRTSAASIFLESRAPGCGSTSTCVIECFEFWSMQRTTRFDWMSCASYLLTKNILNTWLINQSCCASKTTTTRMFMYWCKQPFTVPSSSFCVAFCLLRCMFTTIDPVKGSVRADGEPLKTLRRSNFLFWSRYFYQCQWYSFAFNWILLWPFRYYIRYESSLCE